MSQASELQARLKRHQAALLATVALYPDVLLDRKGVIGPWSIKNLLAYLVAWHEFVLDFLPAHLATGEAPALLDAPPSEQNRFLLAQIRSREARSPYDQVLELKATHRRLATFLRSVDDDQLARDHPWPGWDGTLSAFLSQRLGDMEAQAAQRIRGGVERLADQGDA